MQGAPTDACLLFFSFLPVGTSRSIGCDAARRFRKAHTDPEQDLGARWVASTP